MVSFVLNFRQISERVLLFGGPFNAIEKMSAFFGRGCQHSTFASFLLQIWRNIFKLTVVNCLAHLALSFSFIKSEWSHFDALTVPREEPASFSFFPHGVGGISKIKHTLFAKLQLSVGFLTFEWFIGFSDCNNATEVVKKFFSIDIGN